MTKEEKVQEIINRLAKVFPNPKTALDYKTPFELLIATILSAQCTDKVVNTVTPGLFSKYPTPEAMSRATPVEIDKLITKVTFHSNKAKNIQSCSQMIMEKFGGEVPDNMVDLDSLPGVARKTANVVLGDAFHKPEGVVVDTHVMRLTQLLGLTTQKTPEKIEQELMQIVPKSEWVNFSHYLILAGREYYPARTKDYNTGPLGGLFEIK